jgi:catechol 2,3-dioxygenase-like lactoylglutathione lyase family enzyme
MYLAEIILYVSNQQNSRNFYARLLQREPVLDVPGMTEFELIPGLKLGLMPERGIAKIITPATPHPASAQGVPRCELYLMCPNADQAEAHALACSALPVSKAQNRDWGHRVAYVADADGHILAFASPV